MGDFVRRKARCDRGFGVSLVWRSARETASSTAQHVEAVPLADLSDLDECRFVTAAPSVARASVFEHFEVAIISMRRLPSARSSTTIPADTLDLGQKRHRLRERARRNPLALSTWHTMVAISASSSST